MNRHVILVKHSRPEVLKDRPAREWPLSPAGRERAQRLADRLSLVPFGTLVSSSEPKARGTAEIIAARSGVPLQVLDGFREHERSRVPYLSQGEFEEAVRSLFRQPDRLVFGDETADQAHARFSNAFHAVLSGQGGDPVVIVSHGTVISLFISRLTGRPDFQLWKDLGLPGLALLDIQSGTLLHLENFD